MTRVEMFPVAPATSTTAAVGGRNADDGAGFEVAIRSQLDSGRGIHARDRDLVDPARHRVDPADPRSRNTVDQRSQRPTPDSVFERPDRPVQSDRSDPTDRADHPHHPLRPGHPARFGRSAGDESPAGGSHVKDPSASSSKGAGDAVARGSQPTSDAGPAGEASPTAATPVAGSPTTGAEATVAASGATSSAPSTPGTSATGTPDAAPVVAPATSAGVAPATQAGPTAATDALPTDAGTAAATRTTATAPGADLVAHPAAGDTGTGGADGGQPGSGQAGSGQSGAGQSDGPVPTLVHGRPAALGGGATPRPDGGTETSVTGSTPVGAAVPGSVDATSVPVTTGAVPAVATPAAPGLAPTAAEAAAAAATAPAAPVTAATAATPVATAPAANPVVPLPPQTQVLGALSPLLTGPDGTHRVTVHLEPENLGKVRVQLSLSGGEVALHLIAADAATRETLRQGLPELRAQLEQSGLRTAGMDVQSGPSDLFGGAGAGTGDGAEPRTGHGAIPRHRATTADTVLPSPSTTPRSLTHDVALDVRM